MNNSDQIAKLDALNDTFRLACHANAKAIQTLSDAQGAAMEARKALAVSLEAFNLAYHEFRGPELRTTYG